jgi:hypothetical protein
MIMNKLLDYLSRKLIICLLLMIFSTIFLIFDLGGTDFKQWSSFMQWIFGIYAVGNSAQKISYTVLNNKKK